ncbi:hypothetical protein [Tropicibacter sp. Alg240-R139]|uniref:hypothetical protein n=1 Tax=Tropicibacter sp. Alg240-R139 TaxID=2305991 RepID=UPI0013DE7D02|nr:hypothetical protein [Tropicibacter sp. Alg240-R139]
MPKLIRLYITNVCTGFGLSAIFVGALLWLNVANLWVLISGSGVAALAVFMLWFMNGIVFAGVQFALAVMNLAQRDDDRHRGTPIAVSFSPDSSVARGKPGR